MQRLVEYKKYKEIIEDLRLMEERRAKSVHRGYASKELQQIANKALVDVELESLSLFKLLKAFQRVMERYEDEKHRKAIHTVTRYNYTVAEEQSRLFTMLEESEQVDFESVFGPCETRVHAIVTFLAILELLNLQRLGITQGIGVNNFWLSAKEPPPDEEEE